MFWPSMIVFAVLAITPFIVATLLNRRNGDSLSDVEDVDSAAPEAAGSTVEGEV